MTFVTIGEAADRAIARMRKKSRTWQPKTKRRVGRMAIVDPLPMFVWMSKPAIARIHGRKLDAIKSQIDRAHRVGFLQRREITCPCCGVTQINFKRVR